METITKYILTCKCGKKKETIEKPYSEDYTCKKCLDKLPEPKKEDYDSFYNFISDLENWESSTQKIPIYNYNNIMKDVFESYGVKGKKAEKAWNLAYGKEHGYGYRDVISFFEDLVDLI